MGRHCIHVVKGMREAFVIFIWKPGNQIKVLMDILKSVNGGDRFGESVNVRAAVDCPKRGFVGGLHADFKLDKTGAHITHDFKLFIGN